MDNEVISQHLKRHNYNLIKLIGQGGYSSCYKIFSLQYKKEFVCKITIANYAKERTSYKDEIEYLTHIMHPNVIRIYDFFEEDNMLYMILDYCENGSLEDAYKSGQRIPYKDLLRIVDQIVDALSYLHSNHIAHHDIKPANILIDQNNNVKLADFGISMKCDSGSTHDCRGSLSFCSPEILRKKEYDPMKADVWAFGVTLYRMAFGRLPFKASTPEQLKTLVDLGIYSIPERYDAEIVKLIRDCLCIVPENRPSFEDIRKVIASKVEKNGSNLPSLYNNRSPLSHSKNPNVMSRVSRNRRSIVRSSSIAEVRKLFTGRSTDDLSSALTYLTGVS